MSNRLKSIPEIILECTAAMMTNRDLYLHVRAIAQGQIRSLEEYLRALYALTKDVSARAIPIDDFAAYLEQAFVVEPAPFDEQWLELRAVKLESWQTVLTFQIADLQRMRQTGLLDREDTYFGVDSPSGVRWYNLEPESYLECAVRGEFGGYEASEVIVLVSNPDGDDSDVFEIKEISADNFFGFLWSGASYE